MTTLCTQCKQRAPTKSHTWCSKCKNIKVDRSPEAKAKRAKKMQEYLLRNQLQAEKKRIRELQRESKTTKRRSHYKTTYGITEQFVEELKDKQAGRCAICQESTEGLHVDHDHATGRIRGLLCRFCNSLLGFARDNKTILDSAIRYLGQANEAK